MDTNRIESLRTARGWTLEELGRRVGTTAQSIQRFEKGHTRLINPFVPKIAEALGVDWRDLFEPMSTRQAPSPGLAEEAAPFVPEPGHPLATLKPGKNQDWWTLRSSALSDLGLHAGDIVLLDISQKAVDARRLGDVVIAQVYASDALAAVTVVREFIAPAMLITNSRDHPAESYHLHRDDVAIKGIVVSRMSRVGAG